MHQLQFVCVELVESLILVHSTHPDFLCPRVRGCCPDAAHGPRPAPRSLPAAGDQNADTRPSSQQAVDARTSSGSHFFQGFTTVKDLYWCLEDNGYIFLKESEL